MENLALWIYLFGFVDEFKNMDFTGFEACAILSFITFLAISILMVFAKSKVINNFDDNSIQALKSVRKIFKYIFLSSATIVLFVGTVQTLLPSSKTIAAMIIIPKIAQNKDIQKLPANVAKTLNDAVVTWGKDLEGKQ